MHYHGPIVRPPIEADSIFLEVTVGCTHDSCTFCNFYDGYPFRAAPLSQVEEDLQEVAAVYPNARKIWASGGNPFALSVNKLAELAKLIKQYLPHAVIATYSRVDDLYQKSVDDLKYLHSLGYDNIVLGIESGDDEVLSHVNKGYTSEDILRECKKLDASGIHYRIIYLGGLAGSGNGERNALNTAKVLNQIHPFYMILTTVSILPGTKLYEEMQEGSFKEASERERIMEYRTLIANLENAIQVDAHVAANSIYFDAKLPEEKEACLAHLDQVLERFSDQEEEAYHRRRAAMRSV